MPTARSAQATTAPGHRYLRSFTTHSQSNYCFRPRSQDSHERRFLWFCRKGTMLSIQIRGKNVGALLATPCCLLGPSVNRDNGVVTHRGAASSAPTHFPPPSCAVYGTFPDF